MTPSMHSPYLDEQGRTDAELYLTDIYDGKIVASKWMRKLADMMLPRFYEEYHGYHFDVGRALRVVRFIEEFTVFPEGSKMGQPFKMERFQRNAVELAYGFVDENDIREFRQVLFEVARKNGKCHSCDTEVATPSGWKRIADIHTGDYVFGQNGKPSMVIAESDVFYDKPVFLVTFEDGAQIKATHDHVWTVQTKRSRRCAKDYLPGKTAQASRRKYRKGGWYETTTQEMFDDPSFVYHRIDGAGVEYKYRVPMCLPVEYQDKDLPIDPYTFGYWLGDGHSNGPELTIGVQDLDAAFDILGELGHTWTLSHDHGNTYKMRLDGRGGGKPNPFKEGLRNAGVLGNKHIPDIYLQGSIEQRWELLRGLMDTDGYCSKAGQCQFSQKSRELTEQFVELCSSLGIKANVHSKEARCNGKPAGIVYVVEFWTDKDHSCFHFKRKHDRLKDHLAPRMSCKSIVSIERIPNEPTKCIAIDNPSHLYLVGRQYTATHNTSLMAALCLYHLTSDGELGAEVYNCAKNEQQARKCYGSADAMRLKSPFLKDRIRRGTSQKSGTSALNYDKTGSTLRALSGKASTKDGLSASAVIYDELASVEDNGALFEQLEESTGSRRQPMTWIISSENNITIDGIWDERLKYCQGILNGTIKDDTVLPLLYVQDDKREVMEGLEDDEHKLWFKSNPGLFVIKDVDKLVQRANQASQSPRRLPSLLTKDFCLKSGLYSAFLDIDACINTTPIDFDEIGIPMYVCVGFDLATRHDLCSCVARWKVSGDDRIYELTKFWVASEMIRLGSDDNQKDNVPYNLWSESGQVMDGTTWHWVEIVEGDRVGAAPVFDFLNDLVSVGMYPYCVAYDPWRVGDLEDKSLRRLVGDSRCYAVPQTARVISPLMREHELDLKAHKVICPNPCLHHNRASVQARVDNNDNVFPQKKDLKPNMKIDGFMAELFSLAAYNRYRDEYLAAIGWEPPEN